MTIEEAAEFHRRLRETGEYKTDVSRPLSRADRLLGRFDSWYHLKLIRVISSALLVASRGKFTPEQWGAHSLTALSCMEEIGGRIEITGMENPVSLGRPTVFVGNHMSMVESLILPGILMGINHITAVMYRNIHVTF